MFYQPVATAATPAPTLLRVPPNRGSLVRQASWPPTLPSTSAGQKVPSTASIAPPIKNTFDPLCMTDARPTSHLPSTILREPSVAEAWVNSQAASCTRTWGK